MQQMQHFERELDQRGTTSILRLLKTHYLGLICPGTTFFAGSLPGWWDFTAELNWNNTISTRRLDYMLWPWFERVASYGSVYQVNRFLQTAFYVSWHIVRLFTMDEKKLVYYHQTPKCFLRTSPAWSSPWRRFRCLPSGLRRWRKILQLLNMLFPPRWHEYEHLVVSMTTWTKWMFFDDDMKEI